MKRRHKILILLVLVVAPIVLVLVVFNFKKNNESKKNNEYTVEVAQITDEFFQQQENLMVVVTTLPKDCKIQGGETLQTQFFVKNEQTKEMYFGNEIGAIDTSLYAALVDLQNNHFLFYEIYNHGEYVNFTTAIKDFTVFSILYLSDSNALKEALDTYDSYTAIVENEWYIAWYTRKGV